MTYNQYYLCHHGIKGQKWGKKNGPPYPLDYNKLSSEERREAKSKAISTGNVKEANNNVDYFTNDEIQALLNRFDMKRKVKSIAEKDIKTGKQKLQDLIDATNLWIRVAENGVKVYNLTAKVRNAINSKTTGSDDDWPIIGEGKGKGKNKNNKNNNRNK